ncbi:MAG TPA: glycosyltransferase 87 family protein [Ktedonobacteraceae bacterium]|nr:glycosyltransferase 87 family protein [Ktedonobacteraceae bacterium]
MSISQTSHRATVTAISQPVQWPRGRFLLLCGLLALSIALYVWMRAVAPPDVERAPAFMLVWILSFVPYFAACAYVLLTRPEAGRWLRLELAITLLGALVMRVMLLSLPPNLSHDSWRYLWDARVTLLGYSPYVYGPGDQLFVHLRDFIYANSRFRDVPTIYPPGAQAIYLLSYLIAPSNLYVLKGIFIGFDMLTCGTLAYYLYRLGLDPRRAIIYAWCPLPIVEFAIQGHVDVLTVTFTVLAVLCATREGTGWRVLVGFLVGMATLTKFYPILLLVVVLRPRWRDLALLAACFATITLAYVPYYILGHGQILGFLSKYASQQGTDAGMVQLAMQWVAQVKHFSLKTALAWEHAVDFVVVCIVSLVVLLLRWRQRLSMVAATLIVYSAALAISSHVFPWYTTTLLPWIAVLIGPLWTGKRLSGKYLAVAMAWYFACVSLLGYFFDSSPDWRPYYAFAYDVVLVGLVVAAISGLLWMTRQKSVFKAG